MVNHILTTAAYVLSNLCGSLCVYILVLKLKFVG